MRNSADRVKVGESHQVDPNSSGELKLADDVVNESTTLSIAQPDVITLLIAARDALQTDGGIDDLDLLTIAVHRNGVERTADELDVNILPDGRDVERQPCSDLVVIDGEVRVFLDGN